MTTIDERVVAMAFENQVFEQRVAQTMTTLGKLDTAIKNIGSTTGLENIEKSANKVTLQAPMSALDKLKARFGRAGGDAAQGMNEIERASNKVTLEQPMSALDKLRSRIAGVGANASDGFNEIEKASNHVELRGATTALENLANRFSLISGAATVAFGNIQAQAAMKGASFAKSFSVGPILQGFQEYQTNLGSIQTVMANTEGQRISGLGNTNKALNELNRYSDKTIYNFSEMAKNVGTFTAAGVDLKTSVASIKGIANLAALSGSNSQQASTAMYQLSQAIASGRVGLQDWNSVVNAGMGGRKFQNSLIQTGVAMGTIEKGAVKIDKATGKATVNGQSFRESIMAAPGKTSWLTSDVLTSSLGQFTGDMTDAQLAAKGFTAEQIKSIQATAKSAQNAATQVKTLPQVFDVAKEAIGSGWAQTFSAVFGNFNQAKKTFTELSNFINGHINTAAKARNKMLADWNKLGGRDTLIKGIKQAFQDLGAVLKPIKDAFRDIFPAKTGKDLFAMTKGFADLMKHLKPSKEVITGLRDTFRGVFAVLSIGWYVIKKIVGVVTDLLGLAGKGAGGFLKFTGGIGNFLTALQKAIVGGDALKGVFQGITNVLRLPLELFQSLASAIAGLFSNDNTKNADHAGAAVKKLGDKAQPLEDIFNRIKSAVAKTITVVNKFFEPMTKFISSLGKALANIGTTIGDALSHVNLDNVFKGLNTAFLGGIFLAIKKFTGTGSLIVVKPLKQVGEALGGLTGVLKNMQQALKAGIILAIAAAILALAEGVKLLSSIDPKKLTQAMTGVAIGLGELVGAIGILQAMAKGGGAVSLPAIAGAMVILAGAVVILGLAMKIFATMSWDDMTKGLVGVGGSLYAIGAGVKSIGPSLSLAAPGILAVAVAMNLLAVAMKIFAQMDWGGIAKGLVGVWGSLAAIGSGISAMGPELLAVGPGLIALGVALTLIAGAVGAFGHMDIPTLAKGIIGLGVALAVIGTTLWAMPPGPLLIGQAAGLLILGIALAGIGGAIKLMGTMSLEQIAKGLVVLGGALFELAVGLSLMSTTLPGAAALLLAATALGVLTPVISILGTLSWGTILKGLVAIAGALAVMGVVGLVAAPGISALGIALLALGLAVVTIGAGIYLIVKALILLGDASIKSTGIVIAAITAFIVAMPKLVIEFLKGALEIIKQITVMAPQIVAALTKILDMLLQVIINSTPKLAQAIGVLVQQLLVVITRDSPKLIQAGWTLILNLLKGIDQHIGEVVSRVASIVTKFLNGLAAKAPELTAAGARMLVAFLKGVGDHIGSVVATGARMIVKFLDGISNALPHVVGGVARMIVAFLGAVGSKIPKVIAAGVKLAGKFIKGVADGLVKLADEGAKALISFLHGIANVIRTRERQIIDAGADIAAAIVEGFANGISDIPGILAKALTGMGDESAQTAHAGNMALAAQMAANDRKWNKLHPHHKKHSVVRDVGSSQNLVDIANQNSARRRRRLQQHGKMGVKGVAVTVGPDGKVVASPDVLPAPVQKMTSGQPPGAVKAGENVMGGLATGVQKGLPAAMKIVSGAVQGVYDTMQRETPPDKFEFMSKNIKQGITLGFIGMGAALQNSVTEPIHALLAQNGDLRAFGQFLGGEFRQGLTGGLWADGKSEARKQIEGAFNALRGKLGEENQKLRDTLKSDQDALRQELNQKNKDWGKIDGLRARVAQEKLLLAQSRAASREMLRGMAGEQAILIKLAGAYEKVTAKLEAAKQKLDQLKSDRTQAIQDYTNQFGALPDIGQLLDSAMSDAAMTWTEKWDAQQKKQEDDQKRRAINQVANYKKALQDQIDATIKYNETLNKLRALGLDDVTYKKLLEMGVAGQEFATQLLNQGKPAVDEINALDSKLGTAAGDLGKSAGHSLYDAGIEAAKGFVDGFKAEQGEIKKLMTGIAKSMVAAIKAALGIQSPSRVFAEIGQFSVQGLVDGLEASRTQVQDAAGGIGNDAADAMTKSLSDISDHVQNGINTDVTITPVLDLSQVQRDASKIQDLSNVVPITAAASFGQAAAISQATQETAAAQADAASKATIEVNLEQNNTSPKALDDIEIYRQTRNQLSQVKGALGLATATNP